jgi:hypothetical protein
MGSAYTGLLYVKIVRFDIFDIFNALRGVKNRWHGDTPCPRMLSHKAMGAASCGAASTRALVRRRERDSPQSEIHHLFRESIPDRVTKEKFIVFIKIRKKSNGQK